MDSSLTPSLDDGTSQRVAAQIYEANATAFMIDAGNLPLSGDIIDELDGNACRFIFAYGELPVRGEMRPGKDKAELQLLIEVGMVPYTVESREKRKHLIEIVNSFNGTCPEGVAMDRDQSIFVRGTALLDTPVTATRLISSIVATLFEVNPVLRSLADHLPGLAQAIPESGSNRAA